eukprot:9031459-Pyramimonas_sp.AAC.1
MLVRDHRRAIIEDRTEYRGVCCTCPIYADHRLGCPMTRPSRSPTFKRTPWVWSHGDGRGSCTDPNRTPYDKRLTEDNYPPSTATEVEQTKAIWKSLTPTHCLVHFNRGWHAARPA